MSSRSKLDPTRPSERLGGQPIAFLGQDSQRSNTIKPSSIKVEHDDVTLYESSHFPPTNCDTTSSGPQYSSARIRRRDDPDYIPRPRNAFIFFRSFYIKSMSKSGSGNDSEHQSQLSKNAAMVWSGMSDKEKFPFFEQALREKDLHSEMYPDYRYTPTRKPNGNGSKNAKQTGPQFHHDFVPTSEIPVLELSPKHEPFDNQYDLSLSQHLDNVPFPFGPQRHYKNDASDPTLPPLPRLAGQRDPNAPASSLLCDNPYPSAHYLAAASSSSYPSGPHRGKH